MALIKSNWLTLRVFVLAILELNILTIIIAIGLAVYKFRLAQDKWIGLTLFLATALYNRTGFWCIDFRGGKTLEKKRWKFWSFTNHWFCFCLTTRMVKDGLRFWVWLVLWVCNAPRSWAAHLRIRPSSFCEVITIELDHLKGLSVTPPLGCNTSSNIGVALCSSWLWPYLLIGCDSSPYPIRKLTPLEVNPSLPVWGLLHPWV